MTKLTIDEVKDLNPGDAVIYKYLGAGNTKSADSQLVMKVLEIGVDKIKLQSVLATHTLLLEGCGTRWGLYKD